MLIQIGISENEHCIACANSLCSVFFYDPQEHRLLSRFRLTSAKAFEQWYFVVIWSTLMPLLSSNGIITSPHKASCSGRKLLLFCILRLNNILISRVFHFTHIHHIIISVYDQIYLTSRPLYSIRICKLLRCLNCKRLHTNNDPS